MPKPKALFRTSVLTPLTVLLFVPSTTLSAQQTDQPWRVTAFAGAVSAVFDRAYMSPDGTKVARRSGPTLGLELVRATTSAVSVSGGLHYAVRGARWMVPSGQAIEGTLDVRTPFLDLPVLVHLRAYNSRAFTANILGGVVVSSSGHASVSLLPDPQEIAVVPMEGIETSALVGVSISSRGTIPLQLRMQYQHGLSAATSGFAVHNRSLALLLGIEIAHW